MEGDEKVTRIQARRDRVDNRHVAHEVTVASEAEAKEASKGAARVAESLASLDAKKVWGAVTVSQPPPLATPSSCSH